MRFFPCHDLPSKNQILITDVHHDNAWKLQRDVDAVCLCCMYVSDEAEIRELFKKTHIVRGKGKEAQELADRYFFETLVRIHRAGEGASYTGLKSEPVEPIIQAADKALETGSADALVKMVVERLHMDAEAHGMHHAEMKKEGMEGPGIKNTSQKLT